MPIMAKCPKCLVSYPFDFPKAGNTRIELRMMFDAKSHFVTTCRACGYRFEAMAHEFLTWKD